MVNKEYLEERLKKVNKSKETIRSYLCYVNCDAQSKLENALNDFLEDICQQVNKILEEINLLIEEISNSNEEE